MNGSCDITESEYAIDESDVFCKTLDFQNRLKWYFYDYGKIKISDETETTSLLIGAQGSDRLITGVVYPNTEVSFISYQFLLAHAYFNFDDVETFPICHLRDRNGLSVHGQLVHLPCSLLVNHTDNVCKSDELQYASLSVVAIVELKSDVMVLSLRDHQTLLEHAGTQSCH